MLPPVPAMVTPLESLYLFRAIRVTAPKPSSVATGSSKPELRRGNGLLRDRGQSGGAHYLSRPQRPPARDRAACVSQPAATALRHPSNCFQLRMHRGSTLPIRTRQNFVRPETGSQLAVYEPVMLISLSLEPVGFVIFPVIGMPPRKWP